MASNRTTDACTDEAMVPGNMARDPADCGSERKNYRNRKRTQFEWKELTHGQVGGTCRRRREEKDRRPKQHLALRIQATANEQYAA